MGGRASLALGWVRVALTGSRVEWLSNQAERLESPSQASGSDFCPPVGSTPSGPPGGTQEDNPVPTPPPPHASSAASTSAALRLQEAPCQALGHRGDSFRPVIIQCPVLGTAETDLGRRRDLPLGGSRVTGGSDTQGGDLSSFLSAIPPCVKRGRTQCCPCPRDTTGAGPTGDRPRPAVRLRAGVGEEGPWRPCWHTFTSQALLSPETGPRAAPGNRPVHKAPYPPSSALAAGTTRAVRFSRFWRMTSEMEVLAG